MAGETLRGAGTIYRRGELRTWMMAALAVAAALFALLRTLGPEDRLIPPRGESLLTYSYARAMAEGRPYTLNEGEPTSTGVPGHLLVPLLALFCALGVGDSWLPTVGYALSAVCYLGLVALVWLSAARVRPGSEGLAAALVVLSGQTMWTLFSQTDLGLFVLLAAACFCAAVHERYRLLGVLLVLLVFAHAGGAILTLSLTMAVMWGMAKSHRPPRGLTGAAAAGLLGTVAVAGLNYLVGGQALPMGTALNLNVAYGPPPQAMLNALPDIAKSALRIAYGLSDDQRRAYLVPLLGGALATWGAIKHRGPGWRPGVWWALAAGGLLVFHVLTGELGPESDERIAWFLPIWFLYSAAGLHDLQSRWRWRGGHGVIAVVLLAFQAAGALYHAGELAERTASMGSNFQFLDRVRRNMPGSRTIGDVDLPGMKYLLPGQVIRSVEGGVTRGLQVGGARAHQLEMLRHDPGLRFEFWLFRLPNAGRSWHPVFVGSQVDAERPVFGTNLSLAVYRADWSSIEDTTRPLSPAILTLVGRGELVDRLDVGYRPDEERCGYQVSEPVAGQRLEPFSDTLMLGERKVTDVGRLSLERERFHIQTRPGRMMLIVLRTTGFTRLPMIPGERFPMGWPREISVRVDGRDAGALPLDAADPAAFSEFAMVIPAEMIERDSAEFVIEGPHVSFGYWFYQRGA